MYKIVRTFYRTAKDRALGNPYEEYTFNLPALSMEKAMTAFSKLKTDELWINSIVAIEE